MGADQCDTDRGCEWHRTVLVGLGFSDKHFLLSGGRPVRYEKIMYLLA